MKKSYSKIRHIQESNILLEQRRINELEAIKQIAANAQSQMSDIKNNLTNMENLVKQGGEQTKKFQDWMDTKGKWVATKDGTGKTQYTTLNKGAGYGKFGPSTQAAWEKYGKEWLPTSVNTNYQPPA